MKHSLYIDQLTLQFWEGKIDPYDAVIIARIQDLNPKDPVIKELMYRGHFLITRSWLQEQLPILNLGEEAIFKRLKKLKLLGILESLHRKDRQPGLGNRYLAYFRLSDSFWRIRDKRHKAAAKAAKEAVVPGYDGAVVSGADGPASHGTMDREPSDQDTTMTPLESVTTQIRGSSAASAEAAVPPPVGSLAELDGEELDDPDELPPEAQEGLQSAPKRDSLGLVPTGPQENEAEAKRDPEVGKSLRILARSFEKRNRKEEEARAARLTEKLVQVKASTVAALSSAPPPHRDSAEASPADDDPFDEKAAIAETAGGIL